jgi:hypothetical protein
MFSEDGLTDASDPIATGCSDLSHGEYKGFLFGKLVEGLADGFTGCSASPWGIDPNDDRSNVIIGGEFVDRLDSSP